MAGRFALQLVALVIGVTGVASGRDSDKKSDVQWRRLRGPVRSVSVYEIPGSQTWEQSAPIAQHATLAERFDQRGNLVEKVAFGPGGSQEKRTAYDRGSDGRILTETVYGADERVIRTDVLFRLAHLTPLLAIFGFSRFPTFCHFLRFLSRVSYP